MMGVWRCILLLCMLPPMPSAILAQDDPGSGKAQIMEAMATLAPLHIYGRVVDQHGDPVAGARVCVTWTEVSILPDPGQSAWIDADAAGEWTVTIKRPGRASVGCLEKDGYEFDRRGSAYFAAPDREQLIRHTSKESPLVLTMRKKGESTFLIHKDGRVNFFRPGGVQKVDIVERKALGGRGDPGQDGSGPSDLRIEATFSEDAQRWDITISSSVDDGGMLVTERVLYEAPAEGYGGEHRESVGLRGARKPLSFCLKSRRPPIYSRVDVQIGADKTACIVSYEAWVNPYGLRNLEYEPELDKEWRLRERLEHDTMADLRAGRCSTSHDLKALIMAEKQEKM